MQLDGVDLCHGVMGETQITASRAKMWGGGGGGILSCYNMIIYPPPPGGVLHPNWGTMLSTSSKFGPYGI